MPHSIVKLMMKMFYPCSEITRMASASMDEDLPLSTRLRFKLHLAMCVLCRRFTEQLRFIRDTLRRHPEKLDHSAPSPSKGLSPEAKARISNSLSGEGK